MLLVSKEFFKHFLHCWGRKYFYKLSFVLSKRSSFCLRFQIDFSPVFQVFLKTDSRKHAADKRLFCWSYLIKQPEKNNGEFCFENRSLLCALTWSWLPNSRMEITIPKIVLTFCKHFSKVFFTVHVVCRHHLVRIFKWIVGRCLQGKISNAWTNVCPGQPFSIATRFCMLNCSCLPETCGFDGSPKQFVSWMDFSSRFWNGHINWLRRPN